MSYIFDEKDWKLFRAKKTPKREIEKAKSERFDYLSRKEQE